MATVAELIELMRNNPRGIRYRELCRVCEFYFGAPRQTGSHRIYKTLGTFPNINIQNDRGKAKPYQVRQVLQAIDELESRP